MYIYTFISICYILTHPSIGRAVVAAISERGGGGPEGPYEIRQQWYCTHIQEFGRLVRAGGTQNCQHSEEKRVFVPGQG